MIQDITFTKLQNRFSKAVKLNYSDCGVLLDLSHFSFKHFIFIGLIIVSLAESKHQWYENLVTLLQCDVVLNRACQYVFLLQY